MDVFISGVKGSGKTYYAVNHISKLKDPSKVLHNIKGLSLGKNIGELAKEWGFPSILPFFFDSLHNEHLDDGITPNPARDPRFEELKGHLYVIDECQNIFNRSFKNHDVDKFFSNARHYDIDIFLLTQDDKLVSPTIQVHPEIQLRAVSTTANPLPFLFQYRKMSGGMRGEQTGMAYALKRQKVFKMYKSSDTEKGGKDAHARSRPMVKFLILVILCAIGGIYYLRHWADSKRQPKENSSITQSAPDPLAGSRQSGRTAPPRSTYSSGSTSDYSQPGYPLSITDKIGGIPVPVSIVNDFSGRYVELLGNLYHVSEFPFPLFKTRLGVSALVPQDVFNAVQEYKKQMMLLSSIDPNAAYYNTTQTQTNQDDNF